jgi:hypothetical protein
VSSRGHLQLGENKGLMKGPRIDGNDIDGVLLPFPASASQLSPNPARLSCTIGRFQTAVDSRRAPLVGVMQPMQ